MQAITLAGPHTLSSACITLTPFHHPHALCHAPSSFPFATPAENENECQLGFHDTPPCKTPTCPEPLQGMTTFPCWGPPHVPRTGCTHQACTATPAPKPAAACRSRRRRCACLALPLRRRLAWRRPSSCAWCSSTRWVRESAGGVQLATVGLANRRWSIPHGAMRGVHTHQRWLPGAGRTWSVCEGLF